MSIREKSEARVALERLRLKREKLYPSASKKASKKQALKSPRFNGWTGPRGKAQIPAVQQVYKETRNNA